MRRSPAYIETPQIRLPPAVNISHQNIRGVHSEHTQNFIYPSLKCKWPIHTKLLAPNDLISLSYRTQYCVWNDNVYYELKKKIDWNILVLPDQCSRTFWASSRYRYRDTIIHEIGNEPQRGHGMQDGRTEWNQYTPHNFIVQGYKKLLLIHAINSIAVYPSFSVSKWGPR